MHIYINLIHLKLTVIKIVKKYVLFLATHPEPIRIHPERILSCYVSDAKSSSFVLEAPGVTGTDLESIAVVLESPGADLKPSRQNQNRPEYTQNQDSGSCPEPLLSNKLISRNCFIRWQRELLKCNLELTRNHPGST